MQFLNLLFFVCCLNVATGQPKLIISPTLPIFSLDFENNKQNIFISDEYHSVKKFDWENVQLTVNSFPELTMLENSIDRRYSAFRTKNDRFQVFVMDNQTGKSQVLKVNYDFYSLHISPSNQYLVVESDEVITLFSLENGKELGQYTKKQKISKSCSFNHEKLLVLGKGGIEILNLPHLIRLKTISIEGDFLNFTNSGQYYTSELDGELYIYNSETYRLHGKVSLLESIISNEESPPVLSSDGKQIAFFYNSRKTSFAIYDLANTNLILKKDLSKEIANFKMFEFYQIDPQWKSFAIVNKNNGITLYNLQTGQERCQIYSIGPEDILITIPSGYYMATRRGAFEGVSFEQNGQVYDFAQFDLQYNRPDLVLEHIGLSPPETIEAFRKAYERRVAYLEGKPDSNDHNVPSVQFAKELPIFSNQTKVEVAIKAQDAKELLDVIHVYVNGIPLYGRAGYSIKNRKTRAFQHSINLDLTPGDNRIEVEVFNVKLQRSQKIQSTVRCEAPAVKPNLHLISIGVSQYAESSKNLLYAGKDAQGIHDLFAAKMDLYEKVTLHPLWEKDFSPSNLEKVKQALMQTKESDQVIVFYAGHGVVDSALNYYLGSSNLNFNHPAGTGIRFELLEALLDGIPARQRLMMLDACFSGEIDKSNAKRIQVENTVVGTVRFRTLDLGLVPNNTAYERSFNLMREWFADLRPNTGATILSSTSGLQQAAEGEQWKNGVFTWCLLEGLKGKKADTNQDGMVMLSELRDYLESAVTGQNRQQQSTFRAENLVVDWRVW